MKIAALSIALEDSVSIIGDEKGGKRRRKVDIYDCLC
jgi:hypothetical protein